MIPFLTASLGLAVATVSLLNFMANHIQKKPSGIANSDDCREKRAEVC